MLYVLYMFVGFFPWQLPIWPCHWLSEWQSWFWNYMEKTKTDAEMETARDRDRHRDIGKTNTKHSVVLWKWVWHCYITRNFRNLSLQGMLTGDSIHDSYNFCNFVILFFSPAELMAIEGWDWGWQCPRTIMKPGFHLYLVEQDLIALRSPLESSVRTQRFLSKPILLCLGLAVCLALE